ncbi:FeoA family protein [Mitsuokella sp. oral taxon 131]|uniref:FeoA family protein n=1 Tax=Mitsuokella sp. oral taxon 131 TaxID=1321780 RepID=UPI00040C05D6|nr:ferrous iron transport protein A [Mitsuokella sp. oral taxon 131]
MTLKDGKTGMTLKIVQIEESPLKQRLMSMGLIPGTKVTVLRSAPLGDPIAIGIRSYNLALRREDAERITVETVG